MREDLVPDAVLARIKQATRLLIAGLGGNADAAALVGVRPGTMTRWGSTEYPDVMPIHVVAALELRSGVPTVTRVLADLTGHSLCLADASGEAGDATDHLMGVVCASADAASTMAAALLDRRITPTEANAVVAALGKATEANTRAAKIVALKARGK
jgi:hypothetical protein